MFEHIQTFFKKEPSENSQRKEKEKQVMTLFESVIPVLQKNCDAYGNLSNKLKNLGHQKDVELTEEDHQLIVQALSFCAAYGEMKNLNII